MQFSNQPLSLTRLLKYKKARGNNTVLEKTKTKAKKSFATKFSIFPKNIRTPVANIGSLFFWAANLATNLNKNAIKTPKIGIPTMPQSI